jgi:hypothetical protein
MWIYTGSLDRGWKKLLHHCQSPMGPWLGRVLCHGGTISTLVCTRPFVSIPFRSSSNLENFMSCDLPALSSEWTCLPFTRQLGNSSHIKRPPALLYTLAREKYEHKILRTFPSNCRHGAENCQTCQYPCYSFQPVTSSPFRKLLTSVGPIPARGELLECLQDHYSCLNTHQ